MPRGLGGQRTCLSIKGRESDESNQRRDTIPTVFQNSEGRSLEDLEESETKQKKVEKSEKTIEHEGDRGGETYSAKGPKGKKVKGKEKDGYRGGKT